MFGLLATLVLAATAAVQAQTTMPDNCARIAIVVPGNTCGVICAKDNVSTYQLAHVNPQLNPTCTNALPGQALCLGIKGQDCTETYVIEFGDTCDSIADDFDIPSSTLHANNPNVNSDCSNTYPGEVLCVSPTVYSYS